MSRVGIFAGTFDPVHRGHIAFAKSAAAAADLAAVYLIPERQPSVKTNVTPLSQRLKMLELAVAGSGNLKVLNLPDAHISVAKTLPRLQKIFKEDELFLLLGSDVAQTMLSWPNIDRLLASVQILIGVRAGSEEKALKSYFKSVPATFVISPEAGASSSQIKNGQKLNLLEPRVKDYILEHGLYGSPTGN